MFLELRERGNPVFKLPFPILPEFRRRIWPISGRVRDEVFSVPIPRGKSIHFLWWTKKLRPLNIVSTQAPGCALRTWMKGSQARCDGPVSNSFSADLFLDQLCSL